MKYFIWIFCVSSYSLLNAQEQEVLALDPDHGDLFGYSVAIDGDYAVVGAPLNGGFWSNNAGAAYVYQLIAGTWTYVKKLVPPNAGELGDQFGISVDIEGNQIIVGAHQTDYHNKGNAGAAYIYSGSGTSWSLTGTLRPQFSHAGDRFGASVGITDEWAIVGAPNNDDQGSNAGAAYIFQKDHYYHGWTQRDMIFGSDTENGDVFGSAVAIDGEIAVVGAPGNIGSDNRHSGAAYVFSRDHYGSSWSEDQRLVNSNPDWFDDFGVSVDIEGDYIIVGAPFRNDKEGSAYIFFYSGLNWTEQDELVASDAATFDKFGNDVGITNGFAIVGTRLDDDNGSESGSSYIFEQVGTDWSEAFKLIASDGMPNDKYGHAVDIDGNYAISGAPYHPETEHAQGSAYIVGPSFAIASCANNIALSGIIESGEYMAHDLITAQGTIAQNSSVMLNCSISTELHSTFQVAQGAALTIMTDGCP